jgi:DNA-binding transcriptional MerR regulator
VAVTDSKTLAELSDESGIPARTIRFYIARGLLAGPVKAGRGAVYTSNHLSRLEKIKTLQSEGRTLSEIVRLIGDGPGAESNAQTAAPSPWWQHVIHNDVIVWVRGDISPWRMKEVRAAIHEMAVRLSPPNNQKRKSE